MIISKTINRWAEAKEGPKEDSGQGDRDPDVPSSRRTLPQKASSNFYPNHVYIVVETGGRPGIEGGLWS